MRPFRAHLAIRPPLRVFLATGYLVAAALAHCPGSSIAHAQQERSPARTGPEWFSRAGKEVRSKHYRILSDLDADDTQAFSAHLDLFHAEYARRLAGISQQAPEVPFVLMFQREADYLAVLRAHYGINATGSGGMFFVSPNGAALAFWIEGLPRTRIFHVIQHEGFHQYAFSRFAGALPPWVNEGLAEYFGEAIVVEGRVIVGQSSPRSVELVKKAIDQGATIEFLRLLTMTGNQWESNIRAGNASMQYLQSWSMVQFLGWAENGRYQRPFEEYLRLLRAGRGSEAAFVQAFGTNDVGSFERAWKEWALAAKPSAFAAAAARITFLAEGLRYLSREGVAVDDLEDLLADLRERNFSVEVTVHGRTEKLEATPTILEIPQDDLAKTKPAFELIPARGAAKTPASRPKDGQRAEPRPVPPTVTTRGLEPRELVLRWTKNRRSGEYDFELLSPNDAPPGPKKQAERPVMPPKPTPPTAPSP